MNIFVFFNAANFTPNSLSRAWRQFNNDYTTPFIWFGYLATATYLANFHLNNKSTQPLGLLCL